jgi:hypothetical protein
MGLPIHTATKEPAMNQTFNVQGMTCGHCEKAVIGAIANSTRMPRCRSTAARTGSRWNPQPGTRSHCPGHSRRGLHRRGMKPGLPRQADAGTALDASTPGRYHWHRSQPERHLAQDAAPLRVAGPAGHVPNRQQLPAVQPGRCAHLALHPPLARPGLRAGRHHRAAEPVAEPPAQQRQRQEGGPNHLRRTGPRIEQMQAMQRSLQALLCACPGDERPDCPILDDLAHP